MINKKILSIVVLACLAHALVYSQTTLPDTFFVRETVDYTKQLYDQSTKTYSRLYNGKEYVEFKKNMPEIGTLFFHSDEWETGEVFYDGDLYEHISMRYDLLRDRLVIEHKGYNEIELISEKIRYFRLANHTFVRLNDSKHDRKSLINHGFYDLLYNGNSKVYVKRWKVTEERVETQTSMVLTFKDKSSIYILKGDMFFPIGNKSSVLKVFGDQKGPLKKFISKNKIKYRSNREDAIVKIAAQHDELSR